MIRINLLPVRVSKKTIAGKQQLLLFALGVVLGLILNLLWEQSRAADLRSREAKLKRTQEEIAQLEKTIGEVKNIKDQQAALKEKLDILDKLKAGRTGRSGCWTNWPPSRPSGWSSPRWRSGPAAQCSSTGRPGPSTTSPGSCRPSRAPSTSPPWS